MQSLVNFRIITSIALSGCLVFSLVGIHLFPIFAAPLVWSTGTDMPTPRSEVAYASLGTKIYVIGGAGNTSPGNKKIVEAYDSSSNKWTTSIASLPVAVNHAGSRFIQRQNICGGRIPSIIAFPQIGYLSMIRPKTRGLKGPPCLLQGPPLLPNS